MVEIDTRTLRNIRKAAVSGKRTRKEIAEKYGVSVSTVNRIARMSDREFEEYLKRKKSKRKK